MITRIEFEKHERSGLIIWHIITYRLFGLIPLYTKKTKVRDLVQEKNLR